MGMERLLAAIVTGGLWLIPLVPLVVSGQLVHPHVTGPGFAYRILVEIVFAAWLLLALRSPRHRPQFSPLLGSVFLFVAVVALADALGVDAERAFWGDLARMGGLVSLLHHLAFFVVIGAMFRDERQWLVFWCVSIGVGLVAALHGLAQSQAFGVARVDAFFDFPTTLALYLLFHVFLGCFVLVRWRDRIGWTTRALLFAVIGLQLAALFHTGTRSAIVAVALALLALGVLALRRRPAIAVAVIAVAGTAVGIVVLNADGFAGHPVIERFLDASIPDARNRWRLMSVAWDGFLDRPLLGWGQESFEQASSLHFRPELVEARYDRAHDIFLHWLSAAGILGLVAYLAMPLATLHRLWSGLGRACFSRPEQAVLTAMFGAYYAVLLFLFDTLASFILFFAAMAMVHALPGRVQSSAKPGGRRLAQRGTIPAAIAVSVGLLAAILGFNQSGIQTAWRVQQALKPWPDHVARLAAWRDAMASDGLGRGDAAELFAVQALALPGTGLSPELVRGYRQLGVSVLGAERARRPGDVRLAYLLGRHLARFGRIEEGIFHLRAAHALAPRMQPPMIELGRAHLSSGERAAALDWYGRAHRLDPGNDSYRVEYAAALVLADELASAKALLISRFGTPAPATWGQGVLLGAYLRTGRLRLARDVLRARIEANSGRIEAHFGLAIIHLRLGERARAVEVVRGLVAVNPGLAGMAEAFIARIEAGEIPQGGPAIPGG